MQTQLSSPRTLFGICRWAIRVEWRAPSRYCYPDTSSPTCHSVAQPCHRADLRRLRLESIGPTTGSNNLRGHLRIHTKKSAMLRADQTMPPVLADSDSAPERGEWRRWHVALPSSLDKQTPLGRVFETEGRVSNDHTQSGWVISFDHVSGQSTPYLPVDNTLRKT